ncbi:MAG: IS110 family transposase [Candidatus Binataceae bacterium]
MEVLRVNAAAHVKQVPGRKTDVADGVWLAQLLEHGLLRASFIPPQPIRDLRDLTRYRKSLSEEHTRVANRLEKVLKDAGIKLSTVVTDILGVSGCQILAALVSGTNDPEVLAELARGRLRKKKPELSQVLSGHFREHHAFFIGRLLLDLDNVEDSLVARIEVLLRPLVQELELVCTIPGVREIVGPVIISEIGVDMPPRTSELSDLHGVPEIARRVNLIPTCASTPDVRGRSRMQQFCTYGSVRGGAG